MSTPTSLQVGSVVFFPAGGVREERVEAQARPGRLFLLLPANAQVQGHARVVAQEQAVPAVRVYNFEGENNALAQAPAQDAPALGPDFQLFAWGQPVAGQGVSDVDLVKEVMRFLRARFGDEVRVTEVFEVHKQGQEYSVRASSRQPFLAALAAK